MKDKTYSKMTSKGNMELKGFTVEIESKNLSYTLKAKGHSRE